MSLRDNLDVLGKTKKSAKHFPFQKEITKINKDGNENVANISYKKNYW